MQNFMTYRQTHPVQNENTEHPQPLLRAGRTLQARGAWFNETLDVTLGGETRIFLQFLDLPPPWGNVQRYF